MTLIDQVIRDLTADEARKSKPYYDSEHILSIGVGHNIEDEPLPTMFQEFLDKNGYITEAMIDALLERDLRQAERDCWKMFSNWPAIPEEIKRVFLNMAFNMGGRRFQGFHKLDACAEAGDWSGVVREMIDSEWYRKDVPKRARRLVARVQAYIDQTKKEKGETP
jgi:GH24 family phage-related lysozyme (muramidase)